ncbi:hypothetical protein QNO07_00875 [Streptomyces sp. 549]|uniref:hypothetical protein n=1 Tax=Streptomyces sp. 549 TaxID=3049076 RepID=UPI0024C43202|nr:hypothetical protein [Streptomyces sp. 549]MDK1471992.1 hypothetical protein [Streptomyces sp. 549]
MNTSDSDSHVALPLPDYDSLTVGELEHRIRALEAPDVERLLEHERGHADRVAVRTLLATRLERLEAGAEPSPGGSPRPGRADATRSGSPVGPGTEPEPVHAPPHGSPHQRGKPKADRRP